MRAYPTDKLNDALRNVFDFDAFRPDAMDKLADILRHHGQVIIFSILSSCTNRECSLGVQRLNEEAPTAKRPLDMKFEPKKTDLDKPKFGKEDPNNDPHEGGNTWAGGVRPFTVVLKSVGYI